MQNEDVSRATLTIQHLRGNHFLIFPTSCSLGLLRLVTDRLSSFFPTFLSTCFSVSHETTYYVVEAPLKSGMMSPSLMYTRRGLLIQLRSHSHGSMFIFGRTVSLYLITHITYQHGIVVYKVRNVDKLVLCSYNLGFFPITYTLLYMILCIRGPISILLLGIEVLAPRSSKGIDYL